VTIQYSFTKLGNYIQLEQWTDLNNEPLGRKQGGPPSVLAANSKKYNFSHVFHLNRMEYGKEDSLSEVRLQSLKIQ
jgi:hypothetical protein